MSDQSARAGHTALPETVRGSGRVSIERDDGETGDVGGEGGVLEVTIAPNREFHAALKRALNRGGFALGMALSVGMIAPLMLCGLGPAIFWVAIGVVVIIAVLIGVGSATRAMQNQQQLMIGHRVRIIGGKGDDGAGGRLQIEARRPSSLETLLDEPVDSVQMIHAARMSDSEAAGFADRDKRWEVTIAAGSRVASVARGLDEQTAEGLTAFLKERVERVSR